MSFQIGDKVKWSARYGSELEGIVSHIVPAKYEPSEIFFDGNLSKFLRDNTINFGIHGKRNHESYIVLTGQGKRGGKPFAYWPLVKNLKLVAKAAETEKP